MAQGAFLTTAGLYMGIRGPGNLVHIDWADGAPVINTRTLVSGPQVDGIDWAADAMAVRDAS